MPTTTGMQLPLTDGRAIRMIVALLAAADPLARVERGQNASSYLPLAQSVLGALRNGADTRSLMTVVLDHVPPGASLEILHIELVRGFAEATTDWWDSAASRWIEPVAI
jgi:hypothetical protein